MIHLRSATSSDEPFLFRLYESVRGPEVGQWGLDAAQQGAFLRMQFGIQYRAYGAQFPDADRIIVSDEQAVGRILVSRTAEEIRLVDIALLPEVRNRGIGGELIRALLAEGESKRVPVRLSVLQGNPAARLYLRLGFRVTAEEGLYLQMEWVSRA